MAKHFFAKLFLCEHIVPLEGKKSVAVQHAMLVGFLVLLCLHKEVPSKEVVYNRNLLHSRTFYTIIITKTYQKNQKEGHPMQLPDKKYIASFDIDAQNTFTPVCPDELPVAEGDQIADELNAQAKFTSLRLGSRDAHTMDALWLSDAEHAPLTPIEGHPDLDVRWPAHAIIGTKGFDFIAGLDPKAYDFQIYKGIEPDKHPYGACYHDLKNTLSTGAIEYLRCHGITTVICGGLATDYCVKNTVLQLKAAGFDVILNKAACRGIAPETITAAMDEMAAAGVKFVECAAELEA